jgi:hypothetical protein
VFIRDGHVVLTGAPAASLAQPYKAEWALSHMADFDSAFPASGQRLHAGVQTSPEVSLSGTPVSDAAHSRPGATVMVVPDGVERPVFGRFQLDKLLGRGVVGTVFPGRDYAAGRLATIKIMTPPRESGSVNITHGRGESW